MKASWLHGLTDTEKDEMRQSFAAAAFLRKHLRSMLEKRARLSNDAARSKDAYSSANWAFLQADAVGYERAMQEVIGLLTHESSLGTEPTGEVTGLHPRKPGRPKGSRNVRSKSILDKNV